MDHNLLQQKQQCSLVCLFICATAPQTETGFCSCAHVLCRSDVCLYQPVFSSQASNSSALSWLDVLTATYKAFWCLYELLRANY